MKNKNALIPAIAVAILEMRNADYETLFEAEKACKTFVDAWLIEGKEQNFPGLKRCTLSDTDTASAMLELIGAIRDSRE